MSCGLCILWIITAKLEFENNTMLPNPKMYKHSQQLAKCHVSCLFISSHRILLSPIEDWHLHDHAWTVQRFVTCFLPSLSHSSHIGFYLLLVMIVLGSIGFLHVIEVCRNTEQYIRIVLRNKSRVPQHLGSFSLPI